MKKNYDLLIGGGGSTGLMAVRSSRKLDLTVALAEKDRLGGDCTWTGCVPGKALLRAAKFTQNINDAARFSITSSRPTIDFKSVMGRVRTVARRFVGFRLGMAFDKAIIITP